MSKQEQQQLIEKPQSRSGETAAASADASKLAYEVLQRSAAAQSSKKKFAFFTALLLFACANVYLSAYSRWYHPPIEQAILQPGAENNGHTKVWTWWLARRYLQQRTAPDVVLFGSSQMGSAMCAADAQHMLKIVDALTHRHAVTLEDDLASKLDHKVSVFSLALPGAMCSDALTASRALFNKRLTPKLVIIGLAPRDFIDNTMPYPAATEPYRFYSQYAGPGNLLRHAYIDPMSWLQCAIDSLPCKQLGVFVQTSANQTGSDEADVKVAGETTDAEKDAVNSGQHGAAPMAAVLGGAAIPGKWNVPANIPPIWADNTREYKNRFRDPRVPVYQCETKFYTQFLTEMQSRGVQVVVIGMPSLPMNRALLKDSFWQQFRTMLSSESTAHGARFIDLFANPEFTKSDYLDTVHLNAHGGEKLFSLMAHYIAGDPHLVELLQDRK